MGARYHLDCLWCGGLSFLGCDGPAPFGSSERMPKHLPFFRRLPVDGGSQSLTDSLRELCRWCVFGSGNPTQKEIL